MLKGKIDESSIRNCFAVYSGKQGGGRTLARARGDAGRFEPLSGTCGCKQKFWCRWNSQQSLERAANDSSNFFRERKNVTRISCSGLFGRGFNATYSGTCQFRTGGVRRRLSRQRHRLSIPWRKCANRDVRVAEITRKLYHQASAPRSDDSLTEIGGPWEVSTLCGLDATSGFGADCGQEFALMGESGIFRCGSMK